jgi:hypothetical protein
VPHPVRREFAAPAEISISDQKGPKTMPELEVDLFYRYQALVSFGKEIFEDAGVVHRHDVVEVAADGCGHSFAEYALMYTSVLEHLECQAEKTWCKYTAPGVIDIRITRLTEEQYTEQKCR